MNLLSARPIIKVKPSVLDLSKDTTLTLKSFWLDKGKIILYFVEYEGKCFIASNRLISKLLYLIEEDEYEDVVSVKLVISLGTVFMRYLTLFDFTCESLHVYANCCREIQKLNNLYQGKCLHRKIRLPNFPEFISETIVRRIIQNIEGKKCKKASTGDLQIVKEGVNKRVEVKCFTSTGPSSFGPTECWDVIYFLDARNFLNHKFTCYKIKLSNKSKEWRKLKMNKTTTYAQQCKMGRRPRIGFEKIKNDEIVGDHVICVFEGRLCDLE
jgi:hypothetical protein